MGKRSIFAPLHIAIAVGIFASGWYFGAEHTKKHMATVFAKSFTENVGKIYQDTLKVMNEIDDEMWEKENAKAKERQKQIWLEAEEIDREYERELERTMKSLEKQFEREREILKKDAEEIDKIIKGAFK